MKKAFTLIELLVVIAIIAILAAILFPVFAQAKNAAKKTQDLSNMKQMGLSTQLYMSDNDDTYAQAYWYKDDAGEPGGYVHWSSSHWGYLKNSSFFVSPGDPNKGLPPTLPACSTITTTTIEAPACDSQVPRISYTVNAALMPRKRRTIDPANVVSATSVDELASTILVTSFSNNASCVNDNSNQTVTGIRNKSHRPTNAVMKTVSGGKWSGDNTSDASDAFVFAVTPSIARDALNQCRVLADSTAYPHIKYVGADRFNNGTNYAFADGHAKFHSLESTLNPSRFLWGKSVYSMGNKPVLDQNGQNVR